MSLDNLVDRESMFLATRHRPTWPIHPGALGRRPIRPFRATALSYAPPGGPCIWRQQTHCVCRFAGSSSRSKTHGISQSAGNGVQRRIPENSSSNPRTPLKQELPAKPMPKRTAIPPPDTMSDLIDPRLYRYVVEQTKDYALFVLDPNGRIMTWGAGGKRLKGYDADEIIGRHFSVFYTREGIERKWPDHELKVAALEGHFEDEGWRVRKDGSQFWASVLITALRDENGKLVGFS